ncbi:MAG: hypothetical protein ABIN24_06135 [Dyadobacter sp.]
MVDEIKLLRLLNKDQKVFHNVNELLNKLDYADDNSKRNFLIGLHGKKFIYFEITGSLPDIYERTELYNEVIGLNEKAHPFTFSAKIRDEGHEYLKKHKSERSEFIHNLSIPWITAIFGLVTLGTTIWGVYQTIITNQKDDEIKKKEIQMSELQSKLVQADSITNQLRQQLKARQSSPSIPKPLQK